jgi:hypothetical protein
MPGLPRQQHLRTVEAVAAPADDGSPASGAVEHHAHRLVLRAAVSTGLLGIALIHLLDLQSKLEESPYLGIAYIGLIVGTIVTAGWLIRRDRRGAWATAAALAGLTILGYVVNRTVGMPSAHDDVGNWLEPLGLASLFVEAMVVAGATAGLVSPAAGSPSPSGRG